MKWYLVFIEVSVRNYDLFEAEDWYRGWNTDVDRHLHTYQGPEGYTLTIL